jgi:hypothetical protein
MDESCQETGVGTYVVGIVVAPVTECDDMREHLARGSRFHFYKAGETRRLGMLDRIESWSLMSCSYIYRGLFPIGQDAARDLCLKRLLLDLQKWEEKWGIDELMIESRHGRGDVLDRVTILSAQNGKRAPQKLKYDFVAGSDDPMLWAADAIAGAVRSNVTRKRYTDELVRLRTGMRQVL